MAPQSPPPLLRDLIEIPEASTTSDSDFVLKLADGVGDADRTLADYVIPARLVDSFDEALGLISSALAGGTSRAVYLHGSFGSGKSHFMAVLHALLRGERAARSRPEFASLLAKYDSSLSGRRFLLVPLHLLGAKSLEQRVLGGYLEHVAELYPDTRIPAVHRTDALLDQSRHLRTRIGDGAFIDGLPGTGKEDAWEDGEGVAWTSAELDAAFAAAPDDDARRRLVHDLLSSWQRGFFRNALEDAEGFVSLDRGLTEIAGHAQSLGFDALVLFLDELILWLANSIGDQQFVAREIQKITNFVEGGNARRPIPVITFIARQRDLRELVGEEVTGASELGFQDTLNLARGRFDVITLEDRNLPEITRKRLLKRIGGDNSPADRTIAVAFDALTRVRGDVWDTLLGVDTGTGADLESFRQSYPFSPAFLSTLVHVSSALQRSRTALKLMRQLLVDRRDTLRLGQLIPLGDLYDVISRGGDQPFTEKLKAEFETAQKLYQGKLRPYLLARHEVTEDDLERSRRGSTLDQTTAARIRAFTGDDRLLKTLLLAALAPSVPALHNLTARKLSALNHGSITSPIPGGEIAQINRKIEEWASQFGEIKMIDGDNTGVRLELVGVDVDGILNAAQHFDTLGARKILIKRLLWEDLGITATDQYLDQAVVVWRGTRRTLEVVFGNVRDADDIRDDAFQPLVPPSWRLIVDYPFDTGTHGPADDRGRVQRLGRIADTVCWIPAALTATRQHDLGRLVVLDAALSGQRFSNFAKHLSEDDRGRAQAALTSQRDALLMTMRGVLRQAYGVAAKNATDVVRGYDDHLISLRPGHEPTLPVGARMVDALRSIADQMLEHQYPAHPDFDPDRRYEVLRPADIRVVLEYVRRAVDASDGRVEVEKKDRSTVRRIANPLLLGEMHEAAFIIGRHWVEHFHKYASMTNVNGDLSAADLLAWLDDPVPRGLDPMVANLVLAAFAEQTDRTWVRHGAILTPQPELATITEDLALRTPQRPDPTDWRLALERAGSVLGFVGPTMARGRLVALFVQDLSRRARDNRDAAHHLVDELERHSERLGLSARTGRLHTAHAAADLLTGLDSRHHDIDIVRHLARADLGGPAERTGRSIRAADDVVQALGRAPWDTFDLVAGLGEPWSTEAADIFATLRSAAQDDELTTPLAPVLDRARHRANDLLRRATRANPKRVPEDTTAAGIRETDASATQENTARVRTRDVESVLDRVRKAARQHPEGWIEVAWRTGE